MTLFTVALVVANVTVASDSAAHVAPSVDDNNRYIKVTPMRGGYRLAYTVFFGEIPGASERKRLDTNRDGRIDEAEAKRFGDGLAAEVAASLELDTARSANGGANRGSVHPTWAVVDVGLGMPSVAAGAFSVDMIAYVCAPDGQLAVRDQFRVPRPGETEVVVEDAPGVTVQLARVGANDDPRHDWRFLGAGGPLSDEGLEVRWTASADAPELPSSVRCAATTAGGASSSRLARVLGVVVLACAAAAAAGAFVVGRRARARR